MRHRSLILAVCTALGISASVFAQAGKPAAGNVAQKPDVEEAAPVLSVPASYRYEAAGRRDPFANPIRQDVPNTPGAPTQVPRPPGLPGLLLAETRLSGVVTSKEPTMNRAVLVGPGGKTYFATRGDSLFDAVIKEIRSDSTVVFTIVSRSNKQPTDREVIRAVGSSGENK